MAVNTISVISCIMKETQEMHPNGTRIMEGRFVSITKFYYKMGVLYATSEKYEGFLSPVE